MKVTLTSTSKIVKLEVDGTLIPARIWEGETDSGVPCHAFITRIACENNDESAKQFNDELQEHEPPSVLVQAYDLRMIL